MEHPRPLRRSCSAVHNRIPSLRASTSFSNVKQAIRGSARSDDSKPPLMREPLFEEEDTESSVNLRPCQDAYFRDVTPALIRDRDADIFKKHESNSQSYAKFKPCFPKVCVVERDVSDDESSASDEDLQHAHDEPNQQLSPTGVLLQAVSRRIEAAQQQPPPSIPPRTTSLAYCKPLENASVTHAHPTSETTIRALPSLPESCVPPPVPEKSKLRPRPTTKFDGMLRDGQTSTIDDTPTYTFGTLDMFRTRINSLKMPKREKTDHDQQQPQIETNEQETKDQAQPGTMDNLGVKRNFRHRLSSLRTPSRSFSKDKQQKSHRTQDENDFDEGKKTLYMAIYAARVKKAQREAKARGEDSIPCVEWLKFNSDLAADARVTANGEDLRASSNPGRRLRTEPRACTWVELIEETRHIVLIGPAGYGALTLTEQWLGGCDRKYEHQVWEAITDQSYPYIGIAQSSRQGRWIVHLAQEQPRKHMIQDPDGIPVLELPSTHAYDAADYLSIVEEARSQVESGSSSHKLSTEQMATSQVGEAPKESPVADNPTERKAEGQDVPAEVERPEKQAEKAPKGLRRIGQRLEHVNETSVKDTAIIEEPASISSTSSEFSIPRKPVPP